jgi:hypothetical protein
LSRDLSGKLEAKFSSKIFCEVQHKRRLLNPDPDPSPRGGGEKKEAALIRKAGLVREAGFGLIK